MGGIGMSGHGCYRGKASFDTFTHFRTMANNPTWTDKLLRVRYMPFAWNRLQRLPGRPPRSGSSVGFDRQGNRTKGLGFWFGFLASLGAKEARGTLLRWVLVLVSAFVLTRRRAVAAA
jgi:beta-apo-4'-carotenal oxygenase